MHNPRYFKEKICEELEGAAHYWKKAIDCMKHEPTWSHTFTEMAEGEQEHATDLYKMFMEMYTSDSKKDQFMEAMRDGIMECFSKSMRKIEDLKATYQMMIHETDSKEDDSAKWNPTPPVVSNIMKGISE